MNSAVDESMADDIEPGEAAKLAAQIIGPVLLPGDEGYAAECATYNLLTRLEPALVVGATNADDVQAAVRFAARHGRPVAIRATGHQPGARAHGAVLISTSRMDGVHIDVLDQIARVEAGVRWSQVLQEAAEYGLAPLNGALGTVGVVGYTLGGGQSPTLGRSHGYAADHVRAIEIVTADGELRKVTPDSEPDLFWALRGGKGNYGVVTALEFGLFPVREVYGGGLYFPGERMAEVLHVWRTWAVELPESATTSVAILRLPPVPELPEPLRGAFVLQVRFAFVGPAADGERLIAPIRAIMPPLLDGVQILPYTNVGLIHMDPEHPMPLYERTLALGEMSQDVMDTIIELTGPGSDCPLISVEIRALGGALAREPAVPNAVSSRDTPYVLFGYGAGGPDQAGLMNGHLAGLAQRLEPWSIPGRLVNFLAATEATTPQELALVYGAERYQRLAAIKRAYDPENMFRINHNITPA